MPESVIVTGEHSTGALEQLTGRLEAVERRLDDMSPKDHGHQELLDAINGKADAGHTHPELATPGEVAEKVDEVVEALADDIEEILATEVSEVEHPMETTIEEPESEGPETEGEPEEEEPGEKHPGMFF